tara:strand:+ start:555 stop:764 length:210 start_codon:yes stop_codon:yes gene_type:complete
VTDSFGGFEVQKRLWYYPFWFQIKSEEGYIANSHSTIERAEKLIKIDKINGREINNKPKRKVVKTFNCG